MKPRLRQALLYGGALLVLLAVFTLYTRPDFLRDLADQLWACF
jgi:type II secretory pathway component PulM